MAVASSEDSFIENTTLTSKEEENEDFSSVVKGVHSQLRAQLSQGIPLSNLWSDHIKNKEILERYSQAMYSLATGPWKKHDGGRIKWCVETIKEYFLLQDDSDVCVLKKLLRKDLKRLEFGNPTQLDAFLLPKNNKEIETIVTLFQNRKLHLLDVGSCYNPFSEYSEMFNVTAIDIAPAVKGVIQCDFLNMKISPEHGQLTKQEEILYSMRENSQDVVIFSLLLSYFPSTIQRMQCCINAHSLLSPHGILLVITADSSHQNKHVDMVKSWTVAIEEIGFHRWKYYKDVHLHCFGFRKTSLVSNYDSVSSMYHKNLYIQQDDEK